MSALLKKLSRLREHQIVSDIDIEFSRFLKDLDPDAGEGVLLAACLVSFNYRQGHVCLNLKEYAGQPLFPAAEGTVDIQTPNLSVWLKALQKSPLTGQEGAFKPLILDDSHRLYLQKLWHFEQTLARDIRQRSSLRNEEIRKGLLSDGLKRLFGNHTEHQPDWQQVAAATALYTKFTIISGGPGTGKTTTVLKILVLFLEQARAQHDSLAIALAAPTGKAAARLKESITSGKDRLNVDEEIREAIPEKTMTIHQLLGARRHSSSFKYGAEHKLPHGLMIVDEASMIDQALMSRLIEALEEDACLIMLGDKDQLASVEAGSVMGDLCYRDENSISKDRRQYLESLHLEISPEDVEKSPGAIADNIVLLTKNYRFEAESGIARLAASVNRGDAEEALHILDDIRYPETTIHEITGTSEFDRQLRTLVRTYYNAVVQAGTIEEAFSAFDTFRILTAHRRGPFGVEYINPRIEDIVKENNKLLPHERWYRGKPIMITQNDYIHHLNNGDIGICFPDGSQKNSVFFRKEGQFVSINPSRLPDFEPAYALTVHKSQGSEFRDVLFMLPPGASRVLTRELIYTALTRAKERVMIWGKRGLFADGAKARLHRSSGLRDLLW